VVRIRRRDPEAAHLAVRLRHRDPEGAPTRGLPPAAGILEPLLSNKRTKQIIIPPVCSAVWQTTLWLVA
jgi:hypothetical protein